MCIKKAFYVHKDVISRSTNSDTNPLQMGLQGLEDTCPGEIREIRAGDTLNAWPSSLTPS